MTAQTIEGLELARACAMAADEIQAEDIRVWDLRGISTVTDFLVVCSGAAMPHLRAILRDVEKNVFDWHGVRPANAEGKVDSRWVVLDYIDVMVHVMHGEMREHYALERLWGDAKEIDWRAGLITVAPAAAKGAALKPSAPRKTAAAKTANKKTAAKKVATKKAPAKKVAAKKSAVNKAAAKRKA